MWQYRLLVISGFTALFVGIVDAFVNSPWWLMAFLFYNIVFTGYIGLGVAMHRYFVHRAYRTTKFKHGILLFLSMIPGIGSPISFAIMHRHHHQHSDQELDTHNPKEGFWHSWLLYGMYSIDWFRNVKKVRTVPKDLYREPMVMWMHNNYYRIYLAVFILAMLIDWRIAVYFVLAPVAGGLLNNFHLSWTAHIKGFPGNYRNFETTDNSHNNRLVCWLIGELHNNHHAKPGLCNQAVKPGEFDPAGWIAERFFVETDPEKQYNF